MPREVFELTPPQLEWLIENQTLTGGEALHESSKMGCGVGSFGPSHSAPAGYSPQQEAMYYHQPPLQPPHPHMEGYPSIEYDGGGPVPLHDRDHYNRGMDSSEEELEVHYPSDQDRPEDPYPHRVGKLTWEQSFDNLKIYAEKNGHCNVPRYFNEHPQLGSWVHRQRLKRKSPTKYGYLSQDQIQDLTDLGFCWQLRGEGKQQYIKQDTSQSS